MVFFLGFIFLGLVYSGASGQRLEQKGERPSIDYSRLDPAAYKQGVIRVKFSPGMAENLKASDFSKNRDGTIKTGIPGFDLMGQKHGISHVRSLLDLLYVISPASLEYQERHREWGFHLWYEFGLPEKADIIAALRDFGALESVQVVEPVFTIRQIEPVDESPVIIHRRGRRSADDPTKASKWSPDDPHYPPYQWHFNNTGQTIGGLVGTVGADISMPGAWDVSRGNTSVIVAVLDDAVHVDHPDLAGNIWSGVGYNFVDLEETITPDGNHGTHVAGTIAALTNNGIGVAGIAGGSGGGDGVRIMSCQIFSASGVDNVDLAFIYAADNGAAITQNSWGYDTPGTYNQSVLDAIDYFNANGGGGVLAGGISVFAAGNSNNDDEYYPAYYSGVIAVASTNNKDRKSSFSNYGSWVDISAPGSWITSTTGGGYGAMSGTSAACPHVAGVAALLVSYAPGTLSASQLTALLVNNTDNVYLSNPEYAGQLGSGRLNAAKAMYDLVGEPIPDPVEDPAAFSANVFSSSRINLSWQQNASNNSVMVATSSNGSFGTPSEGTSYIAGQSIPGGGTVLYRGTSNSYGHTGLNPDQTYYYKAWSYNPEYRYSHGITAQGTTPKAYTIHATSGTGGSISPSGNVSVDHGTNKTFAISPDTGYFIEDVFVNEVSIGAVSSYTFENVTSDQSIAATFGIISYTIEASAGENGQISPSGNIIVEHGSNQAFSISPDVGYYVKDVRVNGSSMGSLTHFTFENVTSDHRITAVFGILTYRIEASAGQNGSISPSGNITVEHGKDQAFSIVADTGYYIEDVLVNETSMGPISNYTFKNVTTDHTITSVFAILTYSIEASAGENGSIDPAGSIPVNYGGSQTFAITPYPGHYIKDVLVNGFSVGAVTSYTFPEVTSDQRIEAVFDIYTYTIEASAGANGSIDPSGSITVEYGADQAFSFSPDPGYFVKDVLVNGISMGSLSNYTFDHVTSDQSITVFFEMITHTIEAFAGDHGTIDPSGSITVEHGASQSFTIIPDPGYFVGDVLVNGLSVGPLSDYTFENVTADQTISVVFEIFTYTIEASAGNHGSIEPSGSITVEHGTSQTFVFEADPAYQIAEVMADNENVGVLSSYTFSDIASDHTISVGFEPIVFTVISMSGPGGQIIPEGETPLTVEEELTIEIVPDDGFIISGVLLNGKDIGPVPAYTFQGVDDNQTIKAEFEEIFSVTFQVDMQFAEAYDPESDEVFLSGSMFEWARAGSLRESQLLVPSKSPRIMTNTIELTAGTYEYQYFLNGEEGAEWPRGPYRSIEVPSVLSTNDFFGYRTDPTSAGNLPPDDWLSIYPNPAHDHLFIESKEPLHTILLMDASGRVVMSAPADQNSHRLNISGLPKGFYFLRVTTLNHVFNRTVLLNW
ncbi:MAG: S8 family serine peptidase [Bacteroidales bacterium]